MLDGAFGSDAESFVVDVEVEIAVVEAVELDTILSDFLETVSNLLDVVLDFL